MNSLWDVASLHASYAIIEGVDWVQIYACAQLAIVDLATFVTAY